MDFNPRIYCFWQRLHVFLFELALVLSRPGEDKDGGQVFNVYRQPLPNALINLEEIPDGEAAGGGSFRGAFTGNDKGKIQTLICVLTAAKSNSSVILIFDRFHHGNV